MVGSQILKSYTKIFRYYTLISVKPVIAFDKEDVIYIIIICMFFFGTFMQIIDLDKHNDVDLRLLSHCYVTAWNGQVIRNLSTRADLCVRLRKTCIYRVHSIHVYEFWIKTLREDLKYRFCGRLFICEQFRKYTHSPEGVLLQHRKPNCTIYDINFIATQSRMGTPTTLLIQFPMISEKCSPPCG